MVKWLQNNGNNIVIEVRLIKEKNQDYIDEEKDFI